MLSGIFIEVNEEQLWNALASMLVTLLGIFIEVNAIHL